MTDEKEFELLKFGLIEMFSKELIRPNVDMRFVMDRFQVVVTGKLLGETIDKVHYKYPQDWKEAFKERWFPRWLLKKYPVKYTHIEVDVNIAYPDLHKRIQMPEEKHFVSVSGYDYSD